MKITPQIMSLVEVGQIFSATGGYDANFADFYKVVGKTAKSLKVVKIGKKRTSTGGNCMDYGSCVADPSVIKTQPKTVRLKAHDWYNDGKPSLSFSVEVFHSIGKNAYPWDGTPINEYNYH